ncbi:MAG: hypothetical protein AB7Y46_12685 [Armatimonadota bacterium]
MRLTGRRAAALGTIGIIALAAMWVHAQREARDRSAAAAVLGVAPDALVTQGDVLVQRWSWGEQRGRLWRLPMSTTGPQLPATAAEVTVDLDLNCVTQAYWHDPERWGRGNAGMPARFDEQTCRETADAFVAAHCPYHRRGTPAERSTQRDDEGVMCYIFEWSGTGPGRRDHWLRATVSALTGQVVEYGFAMHAPDPPATAPVKITEQQAVEIFRAALPDFLDAQRIEVKRLWTRSPYAPPGQPVYMVAAEGWVRQAGSATPQGWCGVVYGVNATTGELLTEPWPGRQQSQAPWVDRLPDDLRARVRLTGEQAVQAVQGALRDDMVDPDVRIMELTADSHFAPDGEPVYVVEVSFERRNAQGQPGRKLTWWGVHAESGEVLKSVRY